MANTDIQTFEFIDWSDVDEIEKHSVLSLLRYENNPEVQLPWISIPKAVDNVQKGISSINNYSNDKSSLEEGFETNFANNNGNSYENQNGTIEQNIEEVANNNQGGNKSWASLFSNKKSSSVTATNGNLQTTPLSNPLAVTQSNNNNNNDEGICPIKYPKKVQQIIDPDCFRMGEFLIEHALDGRTISLLPRGLINQSNFCYINSILQALIACPPLYNLLIGLSKNITSNEKRKPTPVIDNMCKFVKEFQHLPATQRVGRRTEKDKKSANKEAQQINCDPPFEPHWIYHMLNTIRTDLCTGRQEDAEEFLGCILNGLNDEMTELMNLIRKPMIENGNTELDDKEWQVMGPKNKGSVTRRTDLSRTPLSNIFGGFLKSHIHRTGDRNTENIQPFYTLQLNIEKATTVKEALEALVSKNQLEGITSSKTNETVEAWQQVTIDELPIVLILHLKCFDFKLDGCKKIIKALEFPIDLKIDAKLLSKTNASPKEKQYKLFAVVYHDGKEASKGHYITDAFHVGYNSWLRYDDAQVKVVQEETVLKPTGSRVPYLLFYRRSDTFRNK